MPSPRPFMSKRWTRRGQRRTGTRAAARRGPSGGGQGRAAWARHASGGRPRPLDGLPVAVKEEAEIAGQRNTLGSLPLRDVVAEHTTAFVQRIIDARAIV